MQLIRCKEEYYVKYDVEIDLNEIKEIRKKLIDRCSSIKHYKYYTTILPNKNDYDHIKNYSEKIVGVKEYNDLYSRCEEEYQVEYDYYEECELVLLIDSLIKGDTNAILEIEEYSFENDKVNMVISERIEDEIVLKESLQLLYKEKILKCIKLKEICRISKYTVNEVIGFFENDLELFMETSQYEHKKRLY